MGAVHEGGRQRKQPDILSLEGQKITTKMSKSNMEKMSMLSIILLVLLIQAEGGTLKMKPKSSKEKETVAPHIVRNPRGCAQGEGHGEEVESNLKGPQEVFQNPWTVQLTWWRKMMILFCRKLFISS